MPNHTASFPLLCRIVFVDPVWKRRLKNGNNNSQAKEQNILCYTDLNAYSEDYTTLNLSRKKYHSTKIRAAIVYSVDLMPLFPITSHLSPCCARNSPAVDHLHSTNRLRFSFSFDIV